MATTINSPEIPSQELREHQENFHSFSKLILFAVLHIMLILVCVALGVGLILGSVAFAV